MVPQFQKELEKLFGKSLKELKSYKVYLLSQLQILEQSKQHLSEYPFEKLSDNRAELYRIKSKSKKKNVRVIYYYRINDSIVLLCTFEEKSKSDYQNGINLAIDRIEDLEGSISL